VSRKKGKLAFGSLFDSSDDSFQVTTKYSLILRLIAVGWLQIVGRPKTCNQPTATSARNSHQKLLV
jgi:hypothetical protein